MLKYGENNIGKVYLGSNPIGKAYYGSNLVYQKGDIHPRPVFYDRLVFDGAAYIDTDIVPSVNASIRIALGNETTKGQQRLFQWGGANSALFGAMLNDSTTSLSRYFSVYYGQSSAVSQSNSSTRLNFSEPIYSFFITPNRWGFGSNYATFTKGAESPTTAIVLGSNLAKTGNPYTGEMGTVCIYGSDAQNATTASDLLNNYTPEYTLRPCTYQGEAGMWCVETSKFYGNSAGAGTLTVQNN